jgi:hypothetical protein
MEGGMMDKAQLVLFVMWLQMIGRIFAALELGVHLVARISPLQFAAQLDDIVVQVSFGMLTAWNDPETAAREIYAKLQGRPLGEQQWKEMVVDRGFPDGHVPYI